MFYGPGTGFDAAPGKPAVHVDAAAWAATLAVASEASGIYNIAEDDGARCRSPRRAASLVGIRTSGL
jgi:hypothetical protein